MGEIVQRKKTAVAQAGEEFVALQTMGGRMHVRWEETAQATPHGQIVYFAKFLTTAGVFDQWVQGCPLQTTSPTEMSQGWQAIESSIDPRFGS